MRLVGHALPAMLLRRPLLSVFRACYDFAQSNCTTHIRVWRSVARDALWVANFFPFAQADFRRQWAPNDCMTDASWSGYAVSKAVWGTEAVASVGRLSERRRYRVHECPAAARAFAFSAARHDPLLDPESVLPIVFEDSLDPYEPNTQFALG